MVVTRHTQVFTNNFTILPALFVPKYLDLLNPALALWQRKAGGSVRRKRCKSERQGPQQTRSKKIEVQSRVQVLDRLRGQQTRLEAKDFQRRMGSRHKQLPLKGKKDSWNSNGQSREGVFMVTAAANHTEPGQSRPEKQIRIRFPTNTHMGKKGVFR